MGLHIDGSYLAPLRLADGLEVACTIFIAFKFVLSLCVASYWVYNRDSFKKRKLAIHVAGIIGGGLVWQVIQIIYIYVDETLISHWFHGYFATVVMMGHFWLQMEIMKAFAIKSRVFTKKNLNRIGLGLTLWWFVTTGVYWAMIPYLGVPHPAWVSLWFNFGYPLFLVFIIFYDTFQSIYIMKSLYAMMKQRAELMDGNVGSTNGESEESKSHLSGFRRLWGFVIVAVVLDWTAVIMTIYSFQVAGVKNQTIINVFAGSIAFSHCDLVAFILDSVKRVKIKSSNKTKSNPSEMKTTTHIEKGE
jgi:hypothetical protein